MPMSDAMLKKAAARRRDLKREIAALEKRVAKIDAKIQAELDRRGLDSAEYTYEGSPLKITRVSPTETRYPWQYWQENKPELLDELRPDKVDPTKLAVLYTEGRITPSEFTAGSEVVPKSSYIRVT